MKKTTIILLFIAITSSSFGQKKDSIPSEIKSKRIILVTSSLTAGYFGSLYILNKAWYAGYPKSKFHFFNDNKEWLQMDKLGHFSTSFTIANYGMQLMSWTGIPRDQAIWYGAAIAPLYMSKIRNK